MSRNRVERFMKLNNPATWVTFLLGLITLVSVGPEKSPLLAAAAFFYCLYDMADRRIGR